MPKALASYCYPTTDKKVNDILVQQDRQKLQRERSLIEELLKGEWKMGVDFGCGEGAFLDLFEKFLNPKKHVLAIEPDPLRAATARATFEKSTEGKIQVKTGGIDLLTGGTETLRADIILCNQVIGHVGLKQLSSIVKGLTDNLAEGGTLALSFPVAGRGLSKHSLGGGWDGEGDFTHFVHMQHPCNSVTYRQWVPLNAFEKAASAPEQGVLPVRAFSIARFPDLMPDHMPFEFDCLPETLEALLDDSFKIRRACLYSIHHEDHVIPIPQIGDMMVWIERNEAAGES